MPTLSSSSAQFAASPVVCAPGSSATTPAPVPTTQVRVLHVINGEHFSGAERVQLHLAHRLPETGFAPDFVCLKPGKFAQEFNASSGEVFEFPMRGRFDLRVVKSLRKLVREDGYELLHAHTPRSALVASLVSRWTGVPWVYHVHSPAARDSARAWTNRFNDYAERLSLANCSHQITVSCSLRNELLRNGWQAERVSVVHNGVPEFVGQRPSPPEGEETWTLGMVALMRPRKGVELLLDALRCAMNAGLDVRLRCIGSFETKEYEGKILARVQQLKLQDNVAFTGFTSNVGAELSKLHALVLPSLFGEGLPMVVLEAMAAGLPVIATAVEGTPEAIRHGQEGLLAEAGSPGSLAAQIESLVRKNVAWDSLSQAATRRHRDCFSDRAMAQGVAAVYARVLNR